MIDLSWLCEETLNLIGYVQNTDPHLNCIARWLSMDDLRKGDAIHPSPSIKIALRWLIFPCRVLSDGNKWVISLFGYIQVLDYRQYVLFCQH